MKFIYTALISLFLATPALAAECDTRMDADTILKRVNSQGFTAYQLNPTKSEAMRAALSARFGIKFEAGDLDIIDLHTNAVGSLLVLANGCTDERMPLTMEFSDIMQVLDEVGVTAEDFKPYIGRVGI